MLMADNLLKSGKIKPNDYIKLRQNITDGTDQTVSLFEEYSKEYAEKMKRFNNNESEAYEAWEMENIEGFSNFTDTKLYINPMDFTVSVAKTKKGDDGVTTIDTEAGFESMGTLRNRLKTKYDKYDVIAGLQVGVDALGEDIQAIRKVGSRYKLGSVTQITDITKRKSMSESDQYAIDLYEKGEETFISSILSSEVSARSILTDYVGVNPETGKPYDFTTNATVAQNDPNFILMTVNDSGKRVPNFSTANGQKQLEVARKALKVQFRMMLDRKEEIQTVAEPTPAERAPTEAEIKRDLLKQDPTGKLLRLFLGKDGAGDGTEETEPVTLLFNDTKTDIMDSKSAPLNSILSKIGKSYTDVGEAEDFVSVLDQATGYLTPDKREKIQYEVLPDDDTYDYARVKITSPYIENGYVYIPSNEFEAQKQVIRDVFDAAQTGTQVPTSKIKSAFVETDDEYKFEKYNTYSDKDKANNEALKREIAIASGNEGDNIFGK
jgi:hypothetical protein